MAAKTMSRGDGVAVEEPPDSDGGRIFGPRTDWVKVLYLVLAISGLLGWAGNWKTSVDTQMAVHATQILQIQGQQDDLKATMLRMDTKLDKILYQHSNPGK